MLCLTRNPCLDSFLPSERRAAATKKTETKTGNWKGSITIRCAFPFSSLLGLPQVCFRDSLGTHTVTGVILGLSASQGSVAFWGSQVAVGWPHFSVEQRLDWGCRTGGEQ